MIRRIKDDVWFGAKLSTVILLIVFSLTIIDHVHTQTTNTFPALQHFPGTPTNPCKATFLAQNDATDQFYTCDVNTLNWALIGGAGAPPSGGATPGISFPARFMYLFGDSSGTFQLGTNNAPTKVGTEAGQTPTATETAGDQFSSAAAGSTNVVAAVGHNQGAGLNGSNYTFGTVSRYSIRIKPITLTNARYWVGMGDVNGPSDYSSAVYASNTPARFYCMFRFAAGTDTNWQAICATDATHQTIVDTGVLPVTASSTLFEIAPTTAMTSVSFFINGTSVATITTNLPTAANRPMTAWMADNENTATSVGAVFYWSQVFYTR